MNARSAVLISLGCMSAAIGCKDSSLPLSTDVRSIPVGGGGG
jgi:hypothetical protein